MERLYEQGQKTSSSWLNCDGIGSLSLAGLQQAAAFASLLRQLSPAARADPLPGRCKSSALKSLAVAFQDLRPKRTELTSRVEKKKLIVFCFG